MIILIAGASHTGKTLFAQKLLEKYHYPSLSLDHLKMGLIRIIEGCCIPFDWEKDFDDRYRTQIKYRCLIMSEKYLLNHYQDVPAFENSMEKRRFDAFLSLQALIRENAENLKMCQAYGLDYILIDEEYRLDNKLQL